MNHYDEKYFAWQKSSGEFGAKADQFKFIDHIKENDNVIDFGCGGGYLISSLICKNKIGIEINPIAAIQAEKNGIKVYNNIEYVENSWADVVISNHALEHCFNPLQELKNIFPKLKKDGIIIFVTPLDFDNRYNPNDINQHLFTWSPQNLGNLFKTAGYEVISVEKIKHRWPPYADHIYYKFGESFFHLIARIYSRLKGDLFQVKIIAKKS